MVVRARAGRAESLVGAWAGRGEVWHFGCPIIGNTLPALRRDVFNLLFLCSNLRSVAQALGHEGNRDATGTEVLEGAQERVMPEPQSHQAT